LQPIIKDKTRAVVGQFRLTHLVSLTPEDLKFEEIEALWRDDAHATALNEYGVAVRMVKIKRLELVGETRMKVYERMQAERLKKASNIEQEGRVIAREIRAAAETAANEIHARARRIAAKIEGEGEREAAQNLKIIRSDPDLYIYLKQVQALRALAETSMTMIVDHNVPPFNVLKQVPPQSKLLTEVDQKETAQGDGPDDAAGEDVSLLAKETK
jgi:membrane protease subunit HflC